MTPATAWATKCATIGCKNERRLGGKLCQPCTDALKALPPAEQFVARARSPELFDEVPPVAPAPLGTTRRPRARTTDRATSHGATANAARGLTTKQRAVRSVFQRYGPGLHDEALVAFYRELRIAQLALGAGPQIPDLTDSSIRTRRAELVKLGYVRDTGRQTTTARGGPTTVWALVTTSEGTPGDDGTPPTTTGTTTSSTTE